MDCERCGAAITAGARFCGSCGASADGDGTPPGPRIGGVTDLEEVGRGGFGVVYRGFEEAIRRPVAVKVLAAGTTDARRLQKWRNEVEAMGRLSNHPNIVSIFRTGVTDDGRDYLVMPFVGGGSLADRLDQQGPFGPSEAVATGAGMARGLAAAHQQGVLHRDLKPSNVLMTEYGEPQLTDFGIARLVDASVSTTSTIEATIPFAAPEVLSGHAASERSDVYGLGATVFALLSGSAPFEAGEDEEPVALAIRVLGTPAPDLRGFGVAPALADVIARALAKDPMDRQSSAEELGAELAQSLEQGAEPRPAVVPSATRVAPSPRPPEDEVTTALPAATSALPSAAPPPGRPAPSSSSRASSRAGWVAAVVAALVAVAAVAFAVTRDDASPSATRPATTIGPSSSQEPDPTISSDLDGDSSSTTALDATTTAPPEASSTTEATTTSTEAPIDVGLSVTPGQELGSGWVVGLGVSDPGSERERNDMRELQGELAAFGLTATAYETTGLASRSTYPSGRVALVVPVASESDASILCGDLPESLKPYGCVGLFVS